MATEQINDWRYPPVPKVIQEALKNYPDLIAWIENYLRDNNGMMSNALSLGRRVDGLHWSGDSLKDALLHLSSQASSKLESARKTQDAVAIAVVEAEKSAVSEARNMEGESLKELLDFYGLEWLNDDQGMKIKGGA
ncbi:MAG: hypothetical protein ACRCV6_05220 [Formosimonas sp.]